MTPAMLKLALLDMLPRQMTLRFDVNEFERGEFSVDFHDGPYSVEYARQEDRGDRFEARLLHYRWGADGRVSFNVAQTYRPDRLDEAICAAVSLNTAHRFMHLLERKLEWLNMEVEDESQG